MRWFNDYLSVGRQLVVSSLFAVVACVLLRMTHPSIVGQLEMGLMSYVAVAWTGVVGANCAYWIIVLSDLARRILRMKDLRLVWHSPASTAGLALLSGAFGFTTLATLVAMAGVEVLALGASTYGDSPVLSALTTVIPIIAGCLSLAAGIMPHWWLYRAVRDARRASLAVLLPFTGDDPLTSVDSAQPARSTVDLYRLVETSPGLPFSTGAIVQYAAAVLGTLVAYFLGR
jgi:hypothetical protein